MKLTKQEKQDIVIIKKYIKELERGFGKSHVKKHDKDLSVDCGVCMSRIAVAYAWHVIDLYE